MSKQYPGGFIMKNPTAPTSSSAPGVWTINQAAYYIKQGLWPLPPTLDPYFPYVTALLHGNGTNAAQNNTFIDSSTNAYTLTRVGNTTQGTFTPFGANWSNYFDGSGDYLTASTVAGDFGSSAFTMEAWVFFNSVSGTQVIGSTYQSSSVGWSFGKSNSTGCFYVGLSGDGNDINGTTTVAVGTWYHVAVSGTPGGTGIKLFVNGVQEGSTYTGAVSLSATVPVYVGDLSALGYVVNGYISNFRLVKGTAVYTSNFTPSTTPLTAISGTSLLTCQSNRFVDNSTNAYTITSTGNVAVQRFSPFSPSAAYSTSVVGGAMYLDGSGDQLTTPSQATFRVDQGDWTWEGWVYPTVLKDGNVLISLGTGGSAVWYTIVVGLLNGSMSFNTNNGTWNFIGNYSSSSGVIKANQWNHFAVVRSGTTVYFFANGAAAGSQASAYVGAGQSGTLYMGSYYNNYNNDGSWYSGHVSNLRFVQGTAIYSGSTYTVPTAPLTAITNTSLLLSNTNAGILDNAMMTDYETVGNAQISTSVYKYGTGSMSFDGTDDRLTSAASPNFAFGTGDFTVEAWIYPNVLTGERGIIQTSDTAGGLKTSYTTGIIINLDVSPYRLNCNVGGTTINSGSTYISATTWTHVAITRASGSVRMFINGTLVGGPTTVTASLDGQNMVIGGYYSTAYLWNGYIDDLRITKGYARYTASFTAPTSQFPDQ